MPVAVIVGTQWGDEGKGKVVDYYASRAQVIVRFNGGANAGHTVVLKGKSYKLHHIPSGVLYPNKINIIGNGMAVDPKKLIQEIEMLKGAGIKPSLAISPRAHVVLPYHFVLDGAEEERKGGLAAGTTKRGIGPCYSDKASRFGVRFCEFIDSGAFREKLAILHPLKLRIIEGAYGLSFSRTQEDIFREYSQYASVLAPYVKDTVEIIHSAIEAKKRILLEGAQATMLDIDHGLYPFGTSSNTTAGGACTGAGIGPTQVDEVVGVVKAYTSRVGSGPLPTEITDSTADFIRNKGGEYGTTTGRPRRIGWLDMVTLRYSARINGLTGLAFTRIDTLAGVKKVKLCTHYTLDGKKTLLMPASHRDFARCKPVYREFPGWKDAGIDGWRKCAKGGFKALPAQARAYLSFISKSVGVPIYFVSVGAGREDSIVLKDVFGRR
ncbi:MAG: adenylosuccinate synthase [Candidatus Micrarchaeota archaeon]|nr:adenylosuccinate synthase [Candidatus Micrarchaeota archaeon]